MFRYYSTIFSILKIDANNSQGHCGTSQTFAITVSRLDPLYAGGLPQDKDREHVTEWVTKIPVGSDRVIAADSQAVFFRVEIFARRNNSSAEIWFPEYRHTNDGSLWLVLALSCQGLATKGKLNTPIGLLTSRLLILKHKLRNDSPPRVDNSKLNITWM